MKESQVEKTIVKWAKDNGIASLKLDGPGDAGKPDRLFLYQGKIVFMEMKATGGRPRKLQIKWLKNLEEQGFTAVWVDDVNEGIEILEKLL
tara:strand:+ start:10800 stop:11072 length:273 start_codon:yes stop_codon:yes gene_type:complete